MNLPDEINSMTIHMNAGKVYVNKQLITDNISELHLDFFNGEWSLSITASKRYMTKGQAMPRMDKTCERLRDEIANEIGKFF